MPAIALDGVAHDAFVVPLVAGIVADAIAGVLGLVSIDFPIRAGLLAGDLAGL